MEIGTAEPIEEDENVKMSAETREISSRSGGDGGPQDSSSELLKETLPDKSRILMWFLLVVVIMTFGGLIGAYVVISTNSPIEWKPLATLPFQVWISTAIIVAASITYQIAKNSLIRRRDDVSKKWFLATTILGAAFISSQLIVWLELVNRGLYMTGNPYVGFFYILTAVHAVHVLGGIIALGYIILRTWRRTLSPNESKKRIVDATVIGWYWHTMGVLWLTLVFLLGFWK